MIPIGVIFMEQKIEKLKEWVEVSQNIVFFGGAGVSTESGIPDFRSEDGLYSQKFMYSPEVMLSYSFFLSNPEDFYEFYKDKMILKGIEPNDVHLALAKLEKAGKLKAVITQNIDGLHQRAGSESVIELHGTVHKNYCMECRKPYELEFIEQDGIPKCSCGGIVRPDVVLYEEQLNYDDLSRAVEFISRADMLIVGGTSLSVYPAAGLLHYYDGDRLVLINNSETAYDSSADLLIQGSIGHALRSMLSISSLNDLSQ